MIFEALNVANDTSPASFDVVVPMIGDREIQSTYAAIGEALGQWERFEMALANLYARFSGYPCWLDKLGPYRSCNPTFVMRLAAVEATAELFFARPQHEDAERDFRDVCRDALFLSARRDRIADGMVRDASAGIGAPRFALQLPWYTPDRHRLEKAEAMGAREIGNVSASIAQLADRAEALIKACASAAH